MSASANAGPHSVDLAGVSGGSRWRRGDDPVGQRNDRVGELARSVGQSPFRWPADNLRLSVNAFFVTDGTRSVLIDTGASNAWHDPTMGLIYDALDEAGIDRAQVTDVAITHKHEDHISGLIAPDGSEAFTKLQRVWIGAGDASVVRTFPLVEVAEAHRAGEDGRVRGKVVLVGG